MLSRLLVATSILGISLLSAVGPRAEPFEEGNIVISTDEVLYEYTPAGVFVRSVPIPYPTGSHPVTESARDVTVVHPGVAAVYNGTFDPYLSVWDTATPGWDHRTHTGWSTVNNGSYGGIASTQHFIFVTDMRTFGDGGADEAMGIVRFDLEKSTAVRFGNDIAPIDLTLGLDGLLYALYPGGSPEGRMVDVFDPHTLAFVRTIYLNEIFGHTGHRSIAVNEAGEMLIADWDGDLQKIDAEGNLLLESNICGIAQSCNVIDIALSTQGVVVIGDRFGGVTVTDEDFSTPSAFVVGSRNIFVDIVPFILIPPTIAVQHELNADGCVEATGPDGATITVLGESPGPDPVTYSWTTSNGQVGEGALFSFGAGVDESANVTLMITNEDTGDMASSDTTVCVSDTTPPTVEILSPIDGDGVIGTDIVVVVTVVDAVDANVENVELFVGSQLVVPYGAGGQEVSVTLFDPSPGEAIDIRITAAAEDANGNRGEDTVQVSLLYDPDGTGDEDEDDDSDDGGRGDRDMRLQLRHVDPTQANLAGARRR